MLVDSLMPPTVIELQKDLRQIYCGLGGKLGKLQKIRLLDLFPAVNDFRQP
jgi:hypothetical protein